MTRSSDMTMIWVYREELRTNDDLIGYDVEGSDGHIGKVDESSTESDRSHLVVDRTRRGCPHTLTITVPTAGSPIRSCLVTAWHPGGAI